MINRRACINAIAALAISSSQAKAWFKHGTALSVFNRNTVAPGDSIANGYLAGVKYSDIVASFFGTTNLPFGHNGYGWQDLINISSEVDAVITSGNPQTLIMEGGTNDLAAGNNITATINLAISYNQSRIAAGWTNRRYILPVLSCSQYTKANQDSYNALLRSNAASQGWIVVPTDQDANLGATGAYANTTWFVDGTHPTAAGQNLIAQYIEGAM